MSCFILAQSRLRLSSDVVEQGEFSEAVASSQSAQYLHEALGGDSPTSS